MKISNNLIQPNTIPASGGAAVPDQGAAFAGRLEKAVQASEQAAKSPVTASTKRSEDAKLKAACKEMEAVFLNMMLSRMRATVPKTKLMGDGAGEETIQSLLDTELTKNMAQAGGMGLADMLYRQLSKSAVKGQASQ
ncbi:rod-binding protein [Sporomusa sp.]|uniref:rod-binding protein n=1 Tax=Sporomusa sp. TaxID=2078658 RepID=UPI002C8EFD71|nr:rod-binding protein [Sporomusa sp.]HWR44353.1 rod-binding protein [Sporomusa sp.]